MFLSRSCEYAIQAVLCVARHSDAEFVPIKTIAKETGLSFHFLGKILQTLTKKDLLKSFKGPRGGVHLAKPAGEMKLIEIVEAVDGLDFYDHCLIGLPECGEGQPCAVHERWGGIREEIFQMFDRTYISELTAYHEIEARAEQV